MNRALLILAILCVFVPGAAYAAGIDPAHTYAWGENIGWLNFGASAVDVSDSALTGYVWSERTGWIALAVSSTTYVRNDGTGDLSGDAWGEGVGYIDFSGVTIDAQGYFHGYATGSTTGRISFNCENTASCASSDFSVRTFWSPGVTAPSASRTFSGSGVPSAQTGSGSSGASSPAPASDREAATNARAAAENPLARPAALFDVVISPSGALSVSYLWWLAPLFIFFLALFYGCWWLIAAAVRRRRSRQRPPPYA